MAFRLRNVVALLSVVGGCIACSAGDSADDNGSTCFAEVGDFCQVAGDCCDGAICTTNSLGLDAECSQTCSSNADCDTGCCHALSNSTSMVCDAAEACEDTCSDVGDDCSTAPCCTGAMCVFKLGEGSSCRALCSANADCPSGCCHEIPVLGGASSRICGEQIDCAAAPDSCTHAHDGACDEPSLCSPGTDTSDCSGACQDDVEPNDSADEATVLAETDDCNDTELRVPGQVLGPDDEDWFSFFGRDDLTCDMEAFAEATGASADLNVCVFPSLHTACGELVCLAGELVSSPETLDGCCSTGASARVAWSTTCGLTESADATVYIAVFSPTLTSCASYDLTYRF